MTDRFLKAAEVASVLNIHLLSVYELAKSGRLAYVRIGPRTIRFPESALKNFLDRSKGGSGEGAVNDASN